MVTGERLVSGIEHKIKKLIEQNVRHKEENIKLHEHIRELEKEIATLTDELKNKQSELLNITLANTLEAEFGVEESKTKIDNLILEIDRCIEVLSE
jgi:seryl-tRNA synthetase